MKGVPAPKRGPYQTPRPSDDAGGGSHGSIRPLHDQRIGNARLWSGNVRPWPEISGPDLESRSPWPEIERSRPEIVQSRPGIARPQPGIARRHRYIVQPPILICFRIRFSVPSTLIAARWLVLGFSSSGLFMTDKVAVPKSPSTSTV